jgi:hypothetical protein
MQYVFSAKSVHSFVDGHLSSALYARLTHSGYESINLGYYLISQKIGNSEFQVTRIMHLLYYLIRKGEGR